MLKAQHIKTILLSGDRKEKCEHVARLLGIDEFVAEQTPEQNWRRSAGTIPLPQLPWLAMALMMRRLWQKQPLVSR